jgi:hypothetical protein
MSDYRIEKSRRRVVVTTLSGQTITGEMFLQPFSRPGGGDERPVDALNGTDQFFPLVIAPDDVLLVAKAQVVHVATSADPEPEGAGDPLVRRMLVEIGLSTGVTHTGSITVEAPVERSRLLDFLNRDHNRFLTLHGVDELLLINHRVIERVRPLD